jgi:sugar/nucleoside kinase (ribokinase family)
MNSLPSKRFVFLGGIPVFDYMITVRMEEIRRAARNDVYIVGSRLLLPIGTIFRLNVDGLEDPVYVNPMANAEIQVLHEKTYFALEFGGKHPEQHPFPLCTESTAPILESLQAQYGEALRGEGDLTVVEVEAPVRISLGGNNKNIIEEIKTLYDSPQLRNATEGITFEHHFFFDKLNPKFRLVEELYSSLGVSLGDPADFHVPGLLPRTGYVFTVISDEGKALDRTILSSRINEEVIPLEQLNRKYSKIQYTLRKDDQFCETHLVFNSMTSHEEIRLVAKLIQTAHASGVVAYLCPTLTLLKGMDRLIESKYYAIENERFYGYRKDFIYTALLPYVKYMILNRDELSILDNAVAKRGIDATASYVARQMNGGKGRASEEGGKVVVTGGSKGARYTERLPGQRAEAFWRKAKLASDKQVRFAERRILCGDDYLPSLASTLGAGDVFTGIFIGLSAVRWDGGHALRAATLGAQHFIQSRTKPAIDDMIAMDELHVRLGTETELVDVIAHHIDESGHPTRYGTISDTLITVTTKQIQHPFREVIELATSLAREH